MPRREYERPGRRSVEDGWTLKGRAVCGGRVYAGSDGGMYVFTCMLVTVPAVMFLADTVPALVGDYGYSPVVAVLGAVLPVATLAFLTMAYTTEPGFIPRQPPRPAAPADGEDDLGVSQSMPFQREVMVNGLLVRIKYCDTCNIYRPPRSSHCSRCGACVSKFDHHCPWVGNCVGRRNYRYFLRFVITVSVTCIFVFAMSVAHLVEAGHTSDKSGTQKAFDAISDAPTAFINALFTFFISWSVAGLSCFHCYLSCSSHTTNEEIKGSFKRRRNPYGRSRIYNFYAAICDPEPQESMIRFPNSRSVPDDANLNGWRPLSASSSTVGPSSVALEV